MGYGGGALCPPDPVWALLIRLDVRNRDKGGLAQLCLDGVPVDLE